MEDTIKGIILGTIIGDAIGSPIDGMSKGHINSMFKKIDRYIDPSPGLTGKMNRWKMPGLYSSISQMMIVHLYFVATQKKRFKEADLIDFISNIPDISENEHGIFRHPGTTEMHFLKRLNEEPSLDDRIFSYPCARVAAFTSPIALYDQANNLFSDAISFSLMFNRDIYSVTGALIFTALLKQIINEKRSFYSTGLTAHAIRVIDSLLKEMETNSDMIFDKGLNPDSLLMAAKKFRNLLSEIENIENREDAEKTIYTFLNRSLKSTVTRATVNHPLAIIPYSIFLTDFCIESPSDTLFTAVNEGGSTSILCSLIGALNGAIFGTGWIPEELKNSLVNKKRINAIIEAAARKKISESQMQDFIDSEVSLTRKEIQEINAKLKHLKPGKKAKKSRKDREKEISRHVVESWTKTDQAKWRKKLDKEKI